VQCAAGGCSRGSEDHRLRERVVVVFAVQQCSALQGVRCGEGAFRGALCRVERCK